MLFDFAVIFAQLFWCQQPYEFALPIVDVGPVICLKFDAGNRRRRHASAFAGHPRQQILWPAINTRWRSSGNRRTICISAADEAS